MTPNSTEKIKVGVCMPGGGLRASCYYGALKSLEDNGFEIEGLVAHSGGSFAAAFYLLDRKPEEISKFLKNKAFFMNFSNKLTRKVLNQLFGDIMIEDLRLPLIIQVSDLISLETVGIKEGRLADIIAYSSNQFFYKPVEYKGMLLIDGGASAGYGTKFLRQEGIKNIIALDVGKPQFDSRFKIVNNVNRYVALASRTTLNHDFHENPSNYFVPDLGSDFSRTDQNIISMIEHGYKKMSESIPEILKSIKSS